MIIIKQRRLKSKSIPNAITNASQVSLHISGPNEDVEVISVVLVFKIVVE